MAPLSRTPLENSPERAAANINISATTRRDATSKHASAPRKRRFSRLIRSRNIPRGLSWINVTIKTGERATGAPFRDESLFFKTWREKWGGDRSFQREKMGRPFNAVVILLLLIGFWSRRSAEGRRGFFLGNVFTGGIDLHRFADLRVKFTTRLVVFCASVYDYLLWGGVCIRRLIS